MRQFKKPMIAIISIILTVVICIATTYAVNPGYTVSGSYASGSYYSALTNVNLTGDMRSDIVTIAKSQLGYHEGSSSSDLSGASSGGGNYTEYGSWFNNQTYWCAMFVSWCAAMAGVPSSIVPKTACANYSAYSDISLYAAGTCTPRAGDIALISSNYGSSVNHVGIISAVDDNNIYTIEGNCSNKVKQGTYSRSNYTWSGSMKILYIGVPLYGANDTLPELPSAPATTTTTKAPTTKAPDVDTTVPVEDNANDAVKAAPSIVMQVISLATKTANLFVDMIMSFLASFAKVSA